MQFFLESIVFTFIGSVIDVTLGIIVSVILNKSGVLTTQVSSYSIMLSLSFSAVIGREYLAIILQDVCLNLIQFTRFAMSNG